MAGAQKMYAFFVEHVANEIYETASYEKTRTGRYRHYYPTLDAKSNYGIDLSVKSCLKTGGLPASNYGLNRLLIAFVYDTSSNILTIVEKVRSMARERSQSPISLRQQRSYGLRWTWRSSTHFMRHLLPSTITSTMTRSCPRCLGETKKYSEEK
jgi:hypothetical protein